MKKDHVGPGSGTNAPSGGNSAPNNQMDMLKTFSSLMGNVQKNEPKAQPIPENYNMKKFSKIILNHDRISREIDRKYNGGIPKK